MKENAGHGGCVPSLGSPRSVWQKVPLTFHGTAEEDRLVLTGQNEVDEVLWGPCEAGYYTGG